MPQQDFTCEVMFARLKQTFTTKVLGDSSSGDSEVLHLQQKCEECTSEYSLNEDWGAIMDLCALVNEGDIRCENESVPGSPCERMRGYVGPADRKGYQKLTYIQYEYHEISGHFVLSTACTGSAGIVRQELTLSNIIP